MSLKITMTFKTWLLFLVMETTLSLSPGPAVFYVVSQGTRRGMYGGLPAATGIISANAIYFTLSATSLGTVIAASGEFFAILKWFGAGYLIFLAINALRSANKADTVNLITPREAPASVSKIYLGALTLQLANPKALLFFLALLPQFIDPRANVIIQVSILATTSILPEFCILLGYAWLAHRATCASTRLGVTSNMNRWLARIEGISLLGCATMVLKLNRSIP